MSTILVALIIIAIIAAISFFLIYSSKQHQKKKTGELLSVCSHIASEHNLNFSSQEVSNSRVIGVDGITRKLLIVEYREEKIINTLIELENVKKCTIKKNYNQVASSPGGSKPESYLQSITLEFSFWKNREPFEISFYDNISNHIYEMSELELKARDWEKMITKLLMAETRERA
jgi:hypothetical protein